MDQQKNGKRVQGLTNRCTYFTVSTLLSLLCSAQLFAANITLIWDPNSETDLAGYKIYYGTAPGTYGSPIILGIQTSYAISLDTPGTYFLAVTAYSKVGVESGFSNEVSTTVSDTTVPSVTITAPTSSGSYSTGSGTLTIGGTAWDNVGVTQVTWSNDRGGSGTAAGTTSWSVTGITPLEGTNILTVTARDAAGNAGTAALTVTYTKTDTTGPTVTIALPTSSGSYSTASGTLTIGGTAWDDAGVTQVTWLNDRGGNGTAAGTTSWSVTGITLLEGTNVLTVRARDASGNAGTAALTVTYTKPDTTAPKVLITVPATSSGYYSTSNRTLTIRGTASDNVGITKVTWSSSRGGSGTATGTTSWSVLTIGLQRGSNILTVKARDAAGNVGTATITVNRSNHIGIVLDTEGAPVEGVAVTLFRADTIQGPFEMVTPGNGMLSLTNEANPTLTDATGYFSWNAPDGHYKVRAEKSGCVAADQRTQAYVETGVLTIPSLQADVRIVLYCGGQFSLFMPMIK